MVNKLEVRTENQCLSPVSESPNDYGKITVEHLEYIDQDLYILHT